MYNYEIKSKEKLIEQVASQEALKKMALNDEDFEVRTISVERLTDE